MYIETFAGATWVPPDRSYHIGPCDRQVEVPLFDSRTPLQLLRSFKCATGHNIN